MGSPEPFMILENRWPEAVLLCDVEQLQPNLISGPLETAIRQQTNQTSTAAFTCAAEMVRIMPTGRNLPCRR